MKVILAGIQIRQKEDNFVQAMEECRRLIEASYREVVGEVTQKSDTLHPKTAFRLGKVEELAQKVQLLDAEEVIFYNALSVSASARLQDLLGVPVIDRTALILEIFSVRARSRQAKLQTELARLQYALPRVAHSKEEASQHSRSSFHNRGSGEMRSALIERQYAKRISLLKQELQKISSKIGQDERRRGRTLLKKVALVGYTNAGKSSLMNAILSDTHSTGTLTYEKDQLFATLDTSVRRIRSASKEYYLYDTVGFVSDLPHTLIEAFQTTLMACREADLLLVVLDASDVQWQEKLQITKDTLKQIHADSIDTLIVYNKIDKVEEGRKMEGICTSTKTMEGIPLLEHAIEERLYAGKEGNYEIPYERMGILDKYRQVLQVDVLEYRDNDMLVHLAGNPVYLQAFEKEKTA